MKLIWSSASPFARKAMLVAHELGIADRIETVSGTGTPMAPNPSTSEANPLSKLPTLITDEGKAIFDSAVICQYLISLSPDQTLLPDSGDARWSTLTLEAMGDGMSEAAVLTRYEMALRSDTERSQGWIDAQMNKIDGALEALEGDGNGHLFGDLNLGQIAVGCALAYLDLRFPDKDWREGRPMLTEWFSTFAARDSAKATEPSA